MIRTYNRYKLVIITSPLLLKPRISKLMLEVRPVWISCRCLKRLSLARPRPLSSSPWVRTPRRVDFPESTLPSTATRRSKNCWQSKNPHHRTGSNIQILSYRSHFVMLVVLFHQAEQNFSPFSHYFTVELKIQLQQPLELS